MRKDLTILEFTKIKKERMDKMRIKARSMTGRGVAVMQRLHSILKSNSGEGFVDTAVKILMSVVIGALVLAGLYLLFKDTILPTLTERITEMFNYSGS